MQNNPFVSWLIPVTKNEIWLVRCLNSIKNQTYTNWEANIIFNNLSSDNEYNNIIQSYIEDNRFKFFL